MPQTLSDKLVIALSSRALFDLEAENSVFETSGDKAYAEHQLALLDQPAALGVAYPLVKKLQQFNSDGIHRVEVVMLSRNDPVSGLRVFRSAKTAGLKLQRGVFTRGTPPYRYLRALGAHLFLSANQEDVKDALDAGFPAARVFFNSLVDAERHPDELRIAFDGDAVLFSDEAERVFQSEGLAAFQSHEESKALLPLPPGPFKPLLEALHKLQLASGSKIGIRLRTALVTARSVPAHERAIRTLMKWGVEVDEAMFLGGLPKGPFLSEFEPDFFFDDQLAHCESASVAGPTGHVAAGVVGGAENQSESRPSRKHKE